MPPTDPLPPALARIQQAHQLYCTLTGQTLHLACHRERMWYELLGAGYTFDDLRTVLAYLQREIRASRRNVGALKLSNLLQLDRFEEDLQISRVRLRSNPSPQPSRPTAPPRTPAQQEQARQRALHYLPQLKAALR
jgi:hypothetical protein